MRQEDIISVYHIDRRGTGLDKVEETDLFFPQSTPHGSSLKNKLKPGREMLPQTNMVGVKIHQNKEAIIDWLVNYDWLAVAATSTDGRRSLRKDHIIKAMIDGGFF